MIVDLGKSWLKDAKCSGMGSEKFFTDHSVHSLQKPTKTLQAAWDEMKMVCGDCPVRRQCARDFLGETEGIYGGMDPAQRYAVRKVHDVHVRALDGPLKEEYAALAWRLSKECGYPGVSVARIMGLGLTATQYLVQWHEDHLREEGEAKAAQTLTVELVETRLPVDFPIRSVGDRDAWVRYGRRVVAGYYLGQTEDDAWFFMKVPLSREDSSAWFKAQDVQMRRSMPRRVMKRVGNESRIYGTALSKYSGDVKQAG